MTDKELQKLNRRQILELMLVQNRRIEKLERELKETRAKLENRRVVLDEAGSIAEAALRISGIFEAAQEAADIYLESIQQNVMQEKGAEFDFDD